MPVKKQRQANVDKDDDLIIISGSSDVTLDITNQGAACETLTINDLTYDSIDLSGITINSTMGATVGGISPVNQYYTTTGTGTYSYDTTNYTFAPPREAKVNIDADGVKIKEDGDLKIGDRSLKDFMDRVEDRLAILHPNEALEDKWEQLKDLRRQYEALEKDILEKEKIMEILKKE